MLIFSGLSSPSPSAKGSTFYPDHSRRWALLAKPTLGVALAMGVLTAGQAQAMVVNLGGQDWEVTTFSGTFNENNNFAIVNNTTLIWIVQGNLCPPEKVHPMYTNIQCYLVSSSLESWWNLKLWTFENGLILSVPPTFTSPATPVPGPLPALGAAAAFGFSRKLRKRIKRSSDAVSSTYSL
jgi:hypothetical protein